MPIQDDLKFFRRRAVTGRFDDPNIEEQYPPDLELEPIHLDIDLRIDLKKQLAGGCVTNTIKARCDGPTSLSLHAVDFADVNAADPDGHTLTWSYDGHKLDISWEEPFTAGEQRRVAVNYQVEKPADGLFFSKPDAAYPDRAWYAASDHETERARHWLPCLDLPTVRTTLDFHLRAEERFTILANGYLVSESSNGDGSKTAHWKLEQLCPSYLICIAIGDFIEAADGTFDNAGNPIKVAYFCSRAHEAQSLRRTFGRTKPMLAWMTAKLGMAFPYPKYYQFALPAFGGAMENISLVSWDEDWCMQDEIAAKELGWHVDLVNVHEMSHSYFGDAIVCRDFAHAWLKESWATYLEQVWCEDNGNHDEADYVYFMNATSYFKEADERYQRPIVTRRFKSSWDMYDGHLYEGGACRLHSLRNELGDHVFWAAVRDYLHRYQGNVVETDHFRHVMEAHSGRSLGKFFDQWFYTAGYPDLEVSFEFDDEHKQGTFEIAQKQADKEKGGPVFTLSTDLSWIINGKEQRLPITIEKERQVVTVTMEKKPDQVRFDPLHKVLHKLSFNPGDPMLRRQLAEARDIIGRIQAAQELIKTNKRINVRAVIDAYDKEPFWGVRREMARMLGRANHEEAIAGLSEIARRENDPMVLQYVFSAASNYRDPELAAAVEGRLGQALPYRANQAAYEALGAQRQAAPWKILAEAAARPSFNGLVQSGALRGLAATRREETIAILLESVRYGATPNNARMAAVSALADIGQGQEKAVREQIVEQLVDLLRDPLPRVRWAAAYGLREMKAPEAIAALEGFSRSLSAQQQVVAERLINGLRQADKTDGSAFKKQVEDLQEKVRKLEGELQKLAAKVEPADGEPAIEV